MNKPTIKQSAIGAGIFTLGGLTGWIAANKFLGKKYAKMADEVIQDVKMHYAATHNRLIFPTPGDAVEALIPEFDPQNQVYDTSTTEIPDDPIVLVDTRQNVFEQAEELTSEELNQEDGNASPRNPDAPYLITVGEFMAGELDYEQISIDYYEGDNTLCDEQESIIPDVEYTVGEQHLDMFGDRSGDEDMVYVRNEKLSTDFEVTRHEGSYSVLVLGIDPALIDEPARPRTRKKSERDN